MTYVVPGGLDYWPHTHNWTASRYFPNVPPHCLHCLIPMPPEAWTPETPCPWYGPYCSRKGQHEERECRVH